MKIISLFQRNYDGDRLVRDEVVPGAEWVLAGEGMPTRKFDGTCCMIRDGVLYKRYDVKHGKKPPANFEAAQDADTVTGHQPGWVPCDRANPADKWHFEAFDNQLDLTDGTYELCGPKVQGNPERAYVEEEVGTNMHILVPHGCYVFQDKPTLRTFDGLRRWFRERSDAGEGVEGIVWHHPDGRMVKIKAKDFGISR